MTIRKLPIIILLLVASGMPCLAAFPLRDTVGLHNNGILLAATNTLVPTHDSSRNKIDTTTNCGGSYSVQVQVKRKHHWQNDNSNDDPVSYNHHRHYKRGRAILLCLLMFVGVFGIHNLYLGYTREGISELMGTILAVFGLISLLILPTLAGWAILFMAAIWSFWIFIFQLYELIMLLTHGMNPKHGHFEKHIPRRLRIKHITPD